MKQQILHSLLWLFPALLCAQPGLIPYTPKADGALDKVFQTLTQQGMENPTLQGVLTFSGNFNFQNAEFSLAFDLETGKALVWVYAVAGTINGADSLVFFPMIQLPFVGFTPLSLPIPSLPAPFSNEVDPEWMDTDEMVQYLSQNGVYQAFHQAYPDSIPDLVWLSKVLVPIPSTQWTLQWIGGDLATSLLCRVNALTGNTQCVAIPVGVDAETYEQNPIAIFPNPAHDVLLIKAPIPTSASTFDFQLFNALGERILNFAPVPNGAPGEFLAPVRHLPRGLYYLMLRSANQIYQLPVILQ